MQKKGNAIIMSDGRVGGAVSPSETCDKTRKINENIILGFVKFWRKINEKKI